jgi:hypothetical protein
MHWIYRYIFKGLGWAVVAWVLTSLYLFFKSGAHQ